VFPLPVVNSSDMSKLDELPEQQLAPQFVSTAADFCNHVLQTTPVKVVGGLEFSGRGMLLLINVPVVQKMKRSK